VLPVTVNVGGKNVALLGTYFSKRLTFGKEEFRTGVRAIYSWWKVSGTWPEDDSQDVLLGEKLAASLGLKAGDQIEVAGQAHRVAGLLSTGGAEDEQIVAPLAVAQGILGRPGAVRRLYVSAVTKPEDSFARRDPKTLRGPEFDRWYCSPYVQSIAYQLQEAIPHSHAEQIRQVAQNEGTVLTRIKGLMLLITVAALLAAALAVSAAMATAMFERRTEVGLMRALGAGGLSVAAIFFAEALLLAVLGGSLGFGGGAILAHAIGRSIFDSQIAVDLVLFPIVIALAVLVTFAGSALAIRRAVKFDPVYALRGEA
jgi:putative ABC transport system permease protein